MRGGSRLGSTISLGKVRRRGEGLAVSERY